MRGTKKLAAAGTVGRALFLRALQHVAGVRQAGPFACDCDGAVWQGTNMAEMTGETRERYPHFLAIPTRWIDNDIYGHVNNVRYYEFFDTVINRYLIEAGGLDIHNGDVIGIAVETTCSFHRSLAFPDVVNAGGFWIGTRFRSDTDDRYLVVYESEMTDSALARAGITSAVPRMVLWPHLEQLHVAGYGRVAP